MTKLFVLVPLLAGALSVSAQAQEVSVTVGFGDLDLTTETGVAHFDQRIDAAVEQVCGDRMGQKALSAVLAIRKCAREAQADIASPRQIAIDRASGKDPSVHLAGASATSRPALSVRRR